ncbi:MAG: hypothetical protein ACLQDQ_13820 [Myxococcaceae bacterium]
MTVLDLLKDLLQQLEALVESNLKLERRLGTMNGVSYKVKRGPGRPRGSGKKSSTTTGKKRGRKSRFTAEMVADIKRARANGTSVADLAKTHKASGPTIYALLRK